MSRVYLSGYAFPGILARLRERGHEVVSDGVWGQEPTKDDWWWWLMNRQLPKDCGDYLVRRVAETKADVFVLGKGWASLDGKHWGVPASCLQRIQKTGVSTAILTWDSPDDVIQMCKTGLLFFCNVIGTCCPDLKRVVKPFRLHSPEARIFTFWPGFDEVAWGPLMDVPQEETCTLMVAGSPYERPTPEYKGPARKAIAWAAIKEGWKVEVWGPETWLETAHGGDPKLAPYYHGPYGYRERGIIWRRAAVNINTHIRWGIPLYSNDRLFMCGGSGKLILSDNQPGLADYFPEVEWFEAGNLDDLMTRAEKIRADPEMARERGQALRRRILAGHTLAHRTDDLLAALGL